MIDHLACYAGRQAVKTLWGRLILVFFFCHKDETKNKIEKNKTKQYAILSDTVFSTPKKKKPSSMSWGNQLTWVFFFLQVSKIKSPSETSYLRSALEIILSNFSLNLSQNCEHIYDGTVLFTKISHFVWSLFRPNFGGLLGRDKSDVFRHGFIKNKNCEICKKSCH